MIFFCIAKRFEGIAKHVNVGQYCNAKKNKFGGYRVCKQSLTLTVHVSELKQTIITRI